MDQTVPTWGYKPDGSAEIFNLAPGEALPDGWQSSPACIVDQDLATADALTARAGGRVFVPPSDLYGLGEPLPLPVDADALANALAEIDRLSGIITTGIDENQRLVGEIEDAEDGLDAAAAEIVSLKALLTKAQEDGGFAVSERDEALAKLDAVTADLTQARADLDAATAPPAAKKGAR